MTGSVRKVIGESFDAYAVSPRKEWVLEWPGQIVICTSTIYWTQEVTDWMVRKDGLQVPKHSEFKILCIFYRQHIIT